MNDLLNSNDFDTDDKLAIIDIFLFETLFEYDKNKCVSEMFYNNEFSEEEKNKFYNVNLNVNNNEFDNFRIVDDKELRLKYLKYIISLQEHDEYLYRSFCMVILDSDVENIKKFNIIKYFEDYLLLLI